MSVQTKAPGAQPNNRNAVKSGVYSQRTDAMQGFSLPCVPPEVKYARRRLATFYRGLLEAARAKFGSKLPVAVASSCHAAAMALTRETVAWHFLRRNMDSLTPDHVERYLSMTDRFATAREKAIERLGLGDDSPADVFQRVMNETPAADQDDGELTDEQFDAIVRGDA